MSAIKTKTMAFIVINNKLLEKIRHSNYLGCDISYDNSKYMKQKINKFSYIHETTNRSLKNMLKM